MTRRVAMNMWFAWPLGIFSLVLGCGTGPSNTPDGGTDAELSPVVMDGFFTDWGEHQVGLVDPADDGVEGGLDFSQVRISNDENYFYLFVELGKEVALDEDPNFVLYIDTDADSGTGIKVEDVGAELVWDLGKQQGEHWFQGQRTTVYYADLGFRAAPSVVASEFELAFARDATPYQDELLFPSAEISVVLRDTSVSDGDRAPDDGSLAYAFHEDAPDLEVFDFSRSSRTQVRILNYNVERPGFEQQSVQDEFERIFQATQPDIIHLQEQDDPGLARTLINDWLPLDGQNWAMYSMTDKVTLSRFPFVPDWPSDRGSLHERILATAVELDDGQRLGLFNLHLTCCDDEVSRQREADSFVAFLREDRMSTSPSLVDSMPFVVTGDLNLVETRGPLDTMMNGEIVYSAFGDDFAPDWDDSPLGDAVPRHTHQAMTYTWRSDYSSYWPSRLDFVLYTDSVLSVDKAFVVETPSTPQDVLDSWNLGENDTTRASDHLPVVVDIFIP